jgi:hypothetical protein
MTRTKSYTLTDVANDVWLDSFSVGNDSLRLPTPYDWSVRKRTLRGGQRDGVDLIEVHNGALSYSVLPTRGMGIWRGEFRGNFLGWHSPVHGPIHPKVVNLAERNGLGWLRGFDEWICRCGLASNGPPGVDNGTALTLHGRIANLPANQVEVRINLDPPYELAVVGRVAETELFGPHLHLTAIVTTIPGSGKLVIHDEVENRSSAPAEMQLLYHCNIGPPFLEAGSRLLGPIREVAPLTPRAAEGIESFESYLGPTPGFTEQVYAFDLVADETQKSLVLLCNSTGDRGLAFRFSRKELPWFVAWKNTAPVEDGYVTGLEPSTNLPNFKAFERQQGRVVMIPAGGKWHCQWSLEVFDTKSGVDHIVQEIATLQAKCRRVIHQQPQGRFSAVP